MRLIINPNDEEAFKRIINYPARGIGDTTVGKIISASTLHNVSLWEILKNPLNYNLNVNSGTAKKLEIFRNLMQTFMDLLPEQNAYEIGNRIVRETGLVSDLYDDKTPEGLSRIQNIEELLKSLHEFVSSRLEEGETNIGLGEFLSEIALQTDQDNDHDENANRVTMMTIHAAKGLEFKNVFVVGLEEDLFPSERCKHNAKEIEEERRLFYVALTRAEENAVLTYAKNRFRNGQSQMCSPSRFLKDIQTEYLKLPSDPVLMRRQEPTIPQYSPVRRETNPVEHQAIGNLHIGDTIQHERFGRGKVIGLTGEGDNAKASVAFDSVGEKTLLLKFARFQVVE